MTRGTVDGDALAFARRAEGATGVFASDEHTRVVAHAVDALPLSGRVLVILPDATRTMPMPDVHRALQASLAARTTTLDYLIALGTHQPMSDAELSAHVGESVTDGRVDATRIHNHRWDLDDTFATFGRITADEMASISQGRVRRIVEVRLNRLLLDYDHVLICGPVFPHEVVGFSGGYKYIVPGVAGPEVIDATHWLGALMTSFEIIGTADTPVRRLVDRAAACVPRPMSCVSLVVSPAGVHGVFAGAPQAAWRAAAAVSSAVHIVRVPRAYSRVLSVMPPMYRDIWTAAKGMYKLEPVVADDGVLIIYAPHITEVSYTHGHLIDAIGYHCRDYFVQQWDRFGHYPGGVLAHATHVAGRGTFDPQRGESLRIRVALATSIPAERCAAINLGYMDPASIDLNTWGDGDASALLVPRAGEMLYRLMDQREETQTR